MYYESEWYKREMKIRKIEMRAHCMKARNAPQELLKATSRANNREEQMNLAGAPSPVAIADQLIKQGILKDDKYEKMRETLRSAQQRDGGTLMLRAHSPSSSQRHGTQSLSHYHHPHHTHARTHSPARSPYHHRSFSPQRSAMSPYASMRSPQSPSQTNQFSGQWFDERAPTPKHTHTHSHTHEDSQTHFPAQEAEPDWDNHPMVKDLSRRTLTSSAGRRLLQASVKRDVEEKLKDAPFDVTKAFPF